MMKRTIAFTSIAALWLRSVSSSGVAPSILGWDITYDSMKTNLTPGSTEELILLYNISSTRAYEYELFEKDCSTEIEIGGNLIASDGVFSTTVPNLDGTTRLTLFCDINLTAIPSSPIWNQTSQEVKVCLVLSLFELFGDDEKMIFAQDKHVFTIGINSTVDFGFGHAQDSERPTFATTAPAPGPPGTATPSLAQPSPVPHWPSTAVVNWKNSINAKEVDSKADIPSACLDNYYDVELKGVANDKDGAHFFLSASVPKGEKTTNDEKKCPQFLAFASRDEKKRIYHVPDFSAGNDYKYSSYLFGRVTLKAIMDAERSVEPVQDKDYNLTSNSCIHYAGRIWRALRLDETNELANFLVENLLENDGFLTIARQKYSADGLRVLAFVTGKGSFENFVKDTVYSQLNIKDDGEYSIGENSDIIASVYK